MTARFPCRIAVAAVLLLSIRQYARAQPAISDAGFEQIDWWGYDGTDEVLIDENSAWGRFTFAHEPVEELWYLNLGVALAPADAPAWMVQNLPLFPGSACLEVCKYAVDLDLSDLGLSSGDDWTTAFYSIEFSTEPASQGPAEATTEIAVQDLEIKPRQWPIVGEDNKPVKPDKAAGHKPGAAKVTEITPPRGMQPVQEADKHCFAGATARSIEWLSRHYKLALKKSAQEIYQDLVDRGVSQPGDGGQGDQAAWISNKANYLREKTGAVTKVWDSAEEIPALERVPEAHGDFLAWFEQELKTGEDVEIAWKTESSAHIVTVERVYRQGDAIMVEYRDDDQTNNAEDTPPTRVPLYKHDGAWVLGANDRKIHFALSESPLRTPSPSGPAITWKDPNGAESKSDARPVDVPVRKGVKGTFSWTYENKPHPGYKPFTIEPKNEKSTYIFVPPLDKTVTDWRAVLRDPKGSSQPLGGDVKRNSPWQWYPLIELPDVAIRIPALAPTAGDEELTIYVAVNLPLYMEKNPFGPVDGSWAEEQTIDEIGVEITDGRIPGVEGIYFATADYDFDPESETGWVPVTGDEGWLDSGAFQESYGPIVVLADISNNHPPPPRFPGDMNCDGSVDFNDIDPFVTALISRDEYMERYPGCDWLNGDINEDGSVDFADIDGFVECLVNGGCP
jgi:hypothetical protein